MSATTDRAPASTSTAAAPAAASFTRRAGTASGVRGLDFTGDPVADRVVAEFAADPVGLGSLGAAIDRVSASFSFDPTRGRDGQRPVPGSALQVTAANSLGSLPPSAAATMSTGDFLARSQSTIARGWQGMLDIRDAGGTVRDGLEGFVAELDGALRRDERGMSAFDHQVDALERQKQALYDDLARGVGDPDELVARIFGLTISQELVAREREKLEELKKLIISLIIGVQVPKGTVRRLVELGLGPMVEELIREMVGNGVHLSTGMVRDLQSLAGMGADGGGGPGLSIHVVPEHHTEETIREDELELATRAVLLADGRLVDPRGRHLQAGAAADRLAVGSADDAMLRREPASRLAILLQTRAATGSPVLG